MARNTQGAATDFTARGMMPDYNGAKAVSQVLKATGIDKSIRKTAGSLIAPVGLLALCMLPAITQALSAISGVLTVGILAYTGLRLFRKGDGGFTRSTDAITAEELAARKARAYAPQGYAGNGTPETLAHR